MLGQPCFLFKSAPEGVIIREDTAVQRFLLFKQLSSAYVVYDGRRNMNQSPTHVLELMVHAYANL